VEQVDVATVVGVGAEAGVDQDISDGQDVLHRDWERTGRIGGLPDADE
jgi:hypothetical protein